MSDAESSKPKDAEKNTINPEESINSSLGITEHTHSEPINQSTNETNNDIAKDMNQGTSESAVKNVHIDSDMVKKVFDYELRIKELELEVKDYKKQIESNSNAKTNYDLLVSKYDKLNELVKEMKSKSSKEIQQLKLDNDLLKQQLESKEKLINKNQKSDSDYISRIQSYEQDMVQFKEEMLRYKQSYQTEHELNQSIQTELSELNKRLSEKETSYSLLETKYNTLQSSLKSHVYKATNKLDVQNIKDNVSESVNVYMTEIQKLETLYNSKLNDFNYKEQQWKTKENEFINKYNTVTTELSDLNNKYLQYQSASNIKLSELQKQLSSLTAQFEEYKLNYQLHEDKMTYDEYKKLEEKYNQLVIDFKHKEDNMNEQIVELTNKYNDCQKQNQSLQEKVQEYEDRIKQQEEEAAKEKENKQNERKNSTTDSTIDEESFLKLTMIFRNCFPTPNSPPPKQWGDPSVKKLVDSFPQTTKQSFLPWYTNIIRPNGGFDPTPYTFTGLNETTYNEMLTILLPLLNTIPNYNILGQSRKHYSYTYDLSVYPIPAIDAPSAPPSTINVNGDTNNKDAIEIHFEDTPDLLLQSLQTVHSKEKSKRLWRWNN